jgi:secreted Zn-dependent insulinase-like peptidase
LVLVHFLSFFSPGLDVDSSFNNNSLYSLFFITVTLTENGIANWIDVVRHVNEYLKMLQTQEPQQWVFDEIQKMSKISFGA